MISALAISYNEEAHIDRYIKSLSFADEIIIVDAFSTDKTKAIADKHKVTFVQREFDNFSDQKNYALSLATHNWVTFFDLDETVSPELAAEIQERITSEPEITAFKVKRNFHFMGRRMKYSGFQNDAVIRVFKKDHCHYPTQLVHEQLEVKGPIRVLKERSNHYSYKSFDRYNEKLTQYSRLQAQALYEKNIRPNLYHFLVRPLYRFLHQFFVKLGILDGKEGFILAYLSAFAVFKRYILLWTMYRHID